VLEAVKQHNPNVKRIVITSSFAAVLDFAKGVRPGYTYTEADWNPMPIEEVRDGVEAYLVPKTLAEKAAFEFVEREKVNSSPCISK
jgi:nucleoside-diphosphate-sugar epimerase